MNLARIAKWGVVAIGLIMATPSHGIDETSLYLAPNGLETARSGFLAMDVTSRSAIIEVASAAWGTPLSEYSMEECGYGEMEFAEFESGVTLAFDGDAFIGWMTEPDAKARFANGIGAGSPVAELNTIGGPIEAFESSIGHEFAAGAVFGVAAGPGTNAPIEMLWSGVSCIFR